MAFSAILRRSISTVVPLAARVVGGHRFRHTSAVSSLIRQGAITHQSNAWLAPTTGFTSRRNYSASSDAKLPEVIESEIECIAETMADEEVVEAPNEFPFKLNDQSGESIVTLEREYQRETITVEAHVPNFVTGAVLKFTCTCFGDEITIESVFLGASKKDIAYEGPDFLDLDENLQKSFLKYLKIRGIKPSRTNFLHEYRIVKDNGRYLNQAKALSKKA